MLTREEIVRFGIDRREFADTPWIFEPGTHGMVRKLAVQRKAGEASFRMIQWRVVCFDSDRFELDFQRPILGECRPRHGFAVLWRRQAARLHLSAKARGGYRTMGPAAEQGLAAAAARSAAGRIHRDLAGSGRAAASAQGKALQRRTGAFARCSAWHLSGGEAARPSAPTSRRPRSSARWRWPSCSRPATRIPWPSDLACCRATTVRRLRLAS